MDMLKVASPMFCAENVDDRWIAIFLRDSENVETPCRGTILREIPMFFWDSNLFTHFFSLCSRGEGEVSGTSFLASHNMAHMELLLFDNSFDAKLVVINPF